jgi:hypothetical protein
MHKEVGHANFACTLTPPTQRITCKHTLIHTHTLTHSYSIYIRGGWSHYTDTSGWSHYTDTSGWSHYTDTSEAVEGNRAQNIVTVQSGFRTSDLSITGSRAYQLL